MLAAISRTTPGWVYVAHTVYYDSLPALFLEDDIFDRCAGRFLSTSRRQALVAALPPAFSCSVAVRHRGPIHDLAEVHALVGPSSYKSASWRERCPRLGAVEDSNAMEGLYIKQEDEDFVLRRLKWVRPGFLAHIAASGEHWRAREPLRNRLADERAQLGRASSNPRRPCAGTGVLPVGWCSSPGSRSAWFSSVGRRARARGRSSPTTGARSVGLTISGAR